MHESTRDRILKAGATVIHRKGFQGTGLTEILAAAGAPKGSFYHYFSSKEAFGLAIVDQYDATLNAIIRDILDREGLGAAARVSAFVGRFRDLFGAQGFTLGCPIGNLAQEMGDLSEAFKDRLAASIEGLAGFFRTVIEAGQAGGEVDAGLPPREAAFFLLSSWQGALMRMKVVRSAEPLDLFECFALRLLGCPAG